MNPETPEKPADDNHVAAMTQNLRQDVASWSEGRSEGTGHHRAFGAETSRSAVAKHEAPTGAPTTAPAVKRVRTKAKPAAAPVASTAPKKPFSMSYDGVSAAAHNAARLSRSTR
jgi:hypothetical protein